MINTCTRTYEATGPGVNALDCEVRYELGGRSWGTDEMLPRGYYFSMQPIMRKGNVVSFTAFSGEKNCIIECGRQSAKRYEQAKAMLDDLVANRVPDFCKRADIEVDLSTYSQRERERRP